MHRKRVKKLVLAGWNKPLRLHTSHILSLDVILSRGLELGSHSPECWKYVFRCSLYVMDLEHNYFSSNSRTNYASHVPAQKFGILGKQNQKDSSLFLPSVTSEYIDDDTAEPLTMPGSLPSSEMSITDLVKKAAPLGSVLKDKQLQPVIEGLSQLVDRFFEDASSRLNLRALISFIAELCASSQEQLFSQTHCHLVGNALHMHRLADVLLRCSRGGRPLVHVMKAWSVAAPHFVEAACHKEQAISKKAVAFIHDIVSTLLSSHPELPHFHFNEALFKPFENLLCLELCDADVQEQIISCICEFVEGCTTDVRSGWRPLFGALRAVHLSGCESKEETHYLRVILDVFNAFLGTENILVFANAAVDCLLCLLKHVRGPADLQDTEDQDIAVLENQPRLGLSMASLKYLERCANILTMMYQMPACPVFHSAHRIQMHKETNLVDPELPSVEIVHFATESNEPSSDFKNGFSKELPLATKITLESLDSPTGILHVWFLLLEGLTGAITTCPKKYQPLTMEALFNMLRALKNAPGSEFGIYCINHLLLPSLQNWLRRASRVYRGLDNFATNFKQCCGLTSDLVVDYLMFLADEGQVSGTDGVTLMVHQLLLVLTECITQSTEAISRLGCACIRHLFVTSAHIFSPELWEIASICLQRACHVSLHSILQLMTCFCNDSENFYGDIGQVKVAVRRDCLPEESLRLSQLAQQVFLLDCQSSNSWSYTRTSGNEDKSFVFLLHPPDIECTQNVHQDIVRVPFRNLIVGLVSHQVLLQTLVTILLQGTQYMLPSLATLMTHVAPPSSPLQPINKNLEVSPLPGFLSGIPLNCLRKLLLSLTESYQTAVQFDSRPGLKFLVQKVAELDGAANLYKQAGISWTIHTLVLFELCLHAKENLTLDYILDEIANNEESKDKKSDDDGEVPAKWSSFVRLKNEFYKLCDSYVDMVLDKEGNYSAVDRISEEPIFLLTVPHDDISAEIQLFKKSEMMTPTGGKAAVPETADIRRGSVDSTDSEGSIAMSTTAADTQQDKVYQVTTEKTIMSMVNEYKRRKTQHSLPSTWRERRRKRNLSSGAGKPIQGALETPLPEDVEKQRKSSILKDAEARIQVCTQLLQSVLNLHLSLPDDQFRPLLPLIFPGVQILVVYASDTGLRTTIADWLNRVGHCCGFIREAKSLTPEA